MFLLYDNELVSNENEKKHLKLSNSGSRIMMSNEDEELDPLRFTALDDEVEYGVTFSLYNGLMEVYLDLRYVEYEEVAPWQDLSYSLSVKEVQKLRDYLTEYLKQEGIE